MGSRPWHCSVRQCSNAIDISVIRAIHLALDQIQKGESGAKAVIITGSNDVFCSGLDLHSIDLKSAEARQRAHFEMRRFMDPLILRLSGFQISHRCRDQWRGGRRRHESCARERHHHRRRQRLFPAVVRAPRAGARCRHYLSPGAPHRRRPFPVVADARGKNRCQDRARMGPGVFGGSRPPSFWRARKPWRIGLPPDPARFSGRFARCIPRRSTIRCRNSCAPNAARRR